MHTIPVDYEWEERAAIMEFDGGLSRTEAEIAARRYRPYDLFATENPRTGLRPYQEQGLAKVEAAWAAGRRRVIFYLPTGGGKSLCAAEMIRRAAARGERVAFVCNRVELVAQASATFAAYGIDHGIVQAANTREQWAPVIVGSIQTITRRNVAVPDLVIIDEVHGAAASGAYHAAINRWQGARIVGLTATPFAKGLGKPHSFLAHRPLFEDIIVGATIKELIALGFLVDCDIYAPSEPDLSGVKTVAGDYKEDELERATDKAQLIGDIVAHWRKMAEGTQTICFAVTIAHSKHIVEQFKAAGIKAKHVDAYTPDAERKQIIGAFRRGEFQILSNCSVLAEGFDVPAASTLILARPTKSLVRYIQMVGRVLRPHDGKQKAQVLDHSGSAKRLGYPTDDLPLELDDGKARTAAETKAPLPKPCPQCHFLKPARVQICPHCGFKPEARSRVVHEEGELTLMDRAKRTTAAERSNAEMSWQEKAAWFGGLKTHGQRKGYNPGWALHAYREKFGMFPNDERVRHAAPCEPSPSVQNWIISRQIRWARSKKRQA